MHGGTERVQSYLLYLLSKHTVEFIQQFEGTVGNWVEILKGTKQQCVTSTHTATKTKSK